MAITVNIKQLTLALSSAVISCLSIADVSQAISLVTSRDTLGANDAVNWSVLGSPHTTVSNPFNVTSLGGLGIEGSKTTGLFEVREQSSSSWVGNFGSGDDLLWTRGSSDSVNFDFSTSIYGAGAQIQSNFYGAFDAFIEAFDISGNSLGAFSLPGMSGAGGNSSAIFIGIESDTNDIARIVLATSLGQDFAINTLSLKTDATGTSIPTPALLPGLIGIGIAALRKRKAEAVKESSEA